MNNPLRIDLVNDGIDTITIKKLFIDGVIDNNYQIDGVTSSDILKGKVVRITPSITGSKTSIITENYKSFKFGSWISQMGEQPKYPFMIISPIWYVNQREKIIYDHLNDLVHFINEKEITLDDDA